MKKIAKLWLYALVASMVFYYIPVYLFSDNLERAIKSMKFKDVAPLLLRNEIDLVSQRSDGTQEKINSIVDKLAKSGRFDTKTSIWDALENNPNIQSVDLVFGHTPDNAVPPQDPLYGDLDVGLRFRFRDGSGIIIVYDAINKGFLEGHGAKVLHISYGYRLTADGKTIDINSEDEFAQLILLIFVPDKNMLPFMYNRFFNANAPVGGNADAASKSVGQKIIGTLSDGSDKASASAALPADNDRISGVLAKANLVAAETTTSQDFDTFPFPVAAGSKSPDGYPIYLMECNTEANTCYGSEGQSLGTIADTAEQLTPIHNSDAMNDTCIQRICVDQKGNYIGAISPAMQEYWNAHHVPVQTFARP